MCVSFSQLDQSMQQLFHSFKQLIAGGWTFKDIVYVYVGNWVVLTIIAYERNLCSRTQWEAHEIEKDMPEHQRLRQNTAHLSHSFWVHCICTPAYISTQIVKTHLHTQTKSAHVEQHLNVFPSFFLSLSLFLPPSFHPSLPLPSSPLSLSLSLSLCVCVSLIYLYVFVCVYVFVQFFYFLWCMSCYWA